MWLMRRRSGRAIANVMANCMGIAGVNGPAQNSTYAVAQAVCAGFAPQQTIM